MSEPGFVIGVDEVGRGPIAGPILVAAFAAPIGWLIASLRDSKAFNTKKQREVVFRQLTRQFPQAFELVWMDRETIDRKGIHFCNIEAMRLAAENLINRVGPPYRLIFDGEYAPVLGGECYPKADATYPAVMAASIIAKVTRDNYMAEVGLRYPYYEFEKNAGYGSEVHREAIINHGLCPEHRRTFEPIRSMYPHEAAPYADRKGRTPGATVGRFHFGSR